ncbi:modulator of macroautophagy TMEM150B [Gadus chalcogrammus]|uniref:modulator of macroautophagy TMEM150B n=1 Tax=Gadus chalcogrammus TaxID=1042646 RepID=UPI0024C278DE|nr:modulator of macroautophagy TMEM150B [Gadus chalcogrammus]
MLLWLLLPICFTAIGLVGIAAVCVVAVSHGSVNITESFPLISYCGSYQPESCIFSQICNICSLLGMLIVVIRYQQIRDLDCHPKTNMACLALGLTSSSGISLMGNFQHSAVMVLHFFGMFLAFIPGLVYFALQLWQMYHSAPCHHKHWLGPLRVACCSACTVLLFNAMVLFGVDHIPGAVACEGLVVTLFFCQFGLLAVDFKQIDSLKLSLSK